MGSVGQRASKLLAVKVGGLKKKSAIWPRPLSNQSARVRLRPGSNLSQSLKDSNFAALWPTDPIFTASKDLNPLKKCAKSQSLCCCLLLGPLWQLKVPLVYFINGQTGGLDCTPLYQFLPWVNYVKGDLWLWGNIFSLSRMLVALCEGTSSDRKLDQGFIIVGFFSVPS